MVIVKLRELSADEQVREEALAREIRLHDEASAINSSRKEGLRKGLEKGRREGLREGKAEGRAEGLREGRAEGLREGERKGINKMIEVMREQGYSEEQIKRILGELYPKK
jgi:flagellar biosynthesis/type III secretory pathway protein FliH